MSNFTVTELESTTLSNFQEDALSISSIIVNTISLLSCLFIFISWILFKELRKLSYGFVFYMALATSIRTVSKMWGGNREQGDIMCTLQGFLIIYGGLSTFWWILSIALVMYSIIFYSLTFWKDPKTSNKCDKTFVIINFTVPLIFAALPLFIGGYSPTGGWCFIDGVSTEGKVLRWVSYYGQLVLILIFCVFVYIRIYFFLKFDPNSPDIKNIHKMFNRIKFYPMCLIIGYTVAVIRRFAGLWDYQLGFPWKMAMSITTGLFGFMLLVVYGRLGKLYKLYRIKYPICDYLCYCLYSEEIDERKMTQKTQDDEDGRSKTELTDVEIAVDIVSTNSTHSTATETK